MEMTIRYAKKQQDLGNLLRAVKEKGKPQQVDDKYLITIGFKDEGNRRVSSNSKSARMVFVGMGFLGEDYVPTKLWEDARKDDKIFLDGLKTLYPDVNGVITDYENVSDDDLSGFFKGLSDGIGTSTIGLCIKTFRAIYNASQGNIADQPKQKKEGGGNKPENKVGRKNKTRAILEPQPVAPVATPEVMPQVAVNIQLQVPSDPTGEVYEKFFAAMKKHLLTNE